MEYNQIIQGDSLPILKTLPDESVNCCVTSPPYWGLRDYGIEPVIWDGVEDCEHDFSIETKAGDIRFRGINSIVGSERNPEVWKGNGKGNFCSKCGAWRGSLGLEPTFELYIKHLCDIFDEVKRVLRKDGTAFVNLGDSYGGTGTGQEKSPNKYKETDGQYYEQANARNIKNASTKGVYDKCLMLIPQRFAIEMVNRGWICRNTIIWHKSNCMPSSAKDRFTVDFEYVYFFVKSKKYWFEQAFEEQHPDGRKKTYKKDGIKINPDNPFYTTGHERWGNPNGRNKRAVWSINTKPFPEAHFAVYPEALIEPMIQAGCPKYICKKCGNAREKIMENHREETRPGNYSKYTDDCYVNSKRPEGLKKRVINNPIEIGLTDCHCNAGFEGGIVLDPFMGAGTTAVVAKKQGKQYLGIELKQEYIDMADKRIKAVGELLF